MGGGVQLVCEGTYGLAWGVVFDGRKDRGFVCVSVFFNASGSVRGHMCVYMHTHTPAAQMGYSDVSPGVGRTPGEPEESRSTKAQYKCRPYRCTQHICGIGRGR